MLKNSLAAGVVFVVVVVQFQIYSVRFGAAPRRVAVAGAAPAGVADLLARNTKQQMASDLPPLPLLHRPMI